MDDSLASVLTPDDIVLGHQSGSMNEAIEHAGGLLMARGSISEEYIEGMRQRETKASTYLGNGVALPHGLLESKDYIRSTGIVVVQHPDGVDWQAGTAHLVVGLAAVGDDHVRVLSQLAEILQDEELCERLWTTTDSQFLYDCLTADPDED
ncbi:MAG: PTS sugar transporter subunit IIA [Acidimicrobiaceae bacterium]|nr:PTS sugar transporter subunit IIA [Acidimicrobiaceae bacterium]